MSHINYKTVCDQLKARLHDTGLSSSDMEVWINAARDKAIREINPHWAIEAKSFTAVVGQTDYQIDDLEPGEVIDVVNVTQERVLIPATEHDINIGDPARSSGSDAFYYTLGPLSYVLAQPSAASALSVVSTSAADITQIVRYRGMVAGVSTDETHTLTGAVAIAGTALYSSLEILGLDSACAGIVTITSNAGAVTNVSIPIGRLHKEYQTITLYDHPSATDAYKVYCYKRLKPLKFDQEPLGVPADWSTLILDLALQEAHQWGYEFTASDSIEKRTSLTIQQFITRYQSGRHRVYSLNKIASSQDRLEYYRTVIPAS
jgi:hypothetical protein